MIGNLFLALGLTISVGVSSLATLPTDSDFTRTTNISYIKDNTSYPCLLDLVIKDYPNSYGNVEQVNFCYLSGVDLTDTSNIDFVTNYTQTTTYDVYSITNTFQPHIDLWHAKSAFMVVGSLKHVYITGGYYDSYFTFYVMQQHAVDFSFLTSSYIFNSIDFSLNSTNDFSFVNLHNINTGNNVTANLGKVYTLHSYNLNIEWYLSSFVPDFCIYSRSQSNYLNTYRVTIYNNPDFDTSYNQGYTDGYTDGYDSGLTNGETTGYHNGYIDGQNAGMQISQTSFMSLFASLVDTPMRMLYSLFNFDLFGTSMLIIILSTLTAIVVIKILKKFI